MKSLRDLLLALLTALRTFLARHTRSSRTPRPVRGPAHPALHAHLRAARPARSEAPAPLVATALRRRPELPPHLAALLARAPDVEPEFVRLRAYFGKAPSSPRIYGPRPAIPDERRPTFTTVSFAARVARAMDPMREWLVHASPGRRVRA